MMLLIAQILLTVVAWNRGWKTLALIPVGTVICLGLLVGIVGAASNTAMDALEGILLMLDFITVLVLAVMSAVKRHSGQSVRSDNRSSESLAKIAGS